MRIEELRRGSPEPTPPGPPEGTETIAWGRPVVFAIGTDASEQNVVDVARRAFRGRGMRLRFGLRLERSYSVAVDAEVLSLKFSNDVTIPGRLGGTGRDIFVFEVPASYGKPLVIGPEG